MHLPVLVQEVIQALAIRADGTYVDGTFGRGGHSRAILERLGPQGRLIALDRDPQAEQAAGGIPDPRFTFARARFSDLSRILTEKKVDGMLFDLGVSSPQLDDPARGFSFRADGPLDMRMDPASGVSAAQWLAQAEEEEIREVIRGYGEERFAKQIAAAIVASRVREPIVGTRQLAGIVGQAVRTREPGQDPATRTFQAVRIHAAAGGRTARAGRAPRGDQLPFARGPHRQALHPGGGAPRNAPGSAAARQRNATTDAQDHEPGHQGIGRGNPAQPTRAQRHPAGGRAHRGAVPSQ
jgi:hypothetical protein